jgi:hypothetical protein
MQGLLCVGCGGYAPYMYKGTSYCHGHLRAVQIREHKAKEAKKEKE